MKKYIVITTTALLFLNQNVFASQPASFVTDKPTTMNVSFINTPSYPAHIQVGNAYSAPYVNSSAMNDMHVGISALMQMKVQTGASVAASLLNSGKQVIKEQAQAGASLINHVQQTIRNNKFKTVCMALGASYVSCLCALLWHNITMSYTCYWGSWKKELPLEALLVADQNTLAQELVTAIHVRYHKNDEPTNFLTPLRAFMQDIETEIAFLQRYIRLWHWLQTVRVTHVFPNQDNAIARAQETLKRVQVLAEIFKRWCAQYTLQMNGAAQG